MKKNDNTNELKHYLSPVGAWALSFGCAVGWGAFVMPGTVFLPLAGPWGTFIGMAIGGLVMFVIGVNYHFLMNRYPDCGGTFAYTKKEMGYDHGFLSTWFLALVYIAIIWANATSIPLITRKLFGGTFQFGFHYEFAGFDVYLGETLLSMGAIAIAACVCIYGGRYTAWIMTAMVAVMIGGILVCAAGVFCAGGVALDSLSPGFLPDKGMFGQVFRIITLAPWAYVGFESVAHSSEEFTFPMKWSLLVMAAALVTGVAAYGLLALMAAAVVPDGYADWQAYVADIDNLDGLLGMPTMHTVSTVMGQGGIVCLGLAAGCAIMTGLVGNTVAGSRLIYALARDNMLPKQFAVLNKNNVPARVIAVVALASLPVPLLGRSAIGWIIDVNSIGATIAYAYTSAVAYHAAVKENRTDIKITGAVGFLISILFTLYFLIPNIWSVSVLAPESYMILVLWSMLGFFFF
ncbi:MAG: APC family permease, partial [Lachnospiraceae bacterium]|nr:APC family permease [Lachnospiraceae bacterium]